MSDNPGAKYSTSISNNNWRHDVDSNNYYYCHGQYTKHLLDPHACLFDAPGFLGIMGTRLFGQEVTLQAHLESELNTSINITKLEINHRLNVAYEIDPNKPYTEYAATELSPNLQRYNEEKIEVGTTILLVILFFMGVVAFMTVLFFISMNTTTTKSSRQKSFDKRNRFNTDRYYPRTPTSVTDGFYNERATSAATNNRNAPLPRKAHKPRFNQGKRYAAPKCCNCNGNLVIDSSDPSSKDLVCTFCGTWHTDTRKAR